MLLLAGCHFRLRMKLLLIFLVISLTIVFYFSIYFQCRILTQFPLTCSHLSAATIKTISTIVIAKHRIIYEVEKFKAATNHSSHSSDINEKSALT